jgi:predicted RNase H-like nuclease
MNPSRKPLLPAEIRLAGVDGCRGGWVVATEHGARVEPHLDRSMGSTIGVDMPIGLPDDRPRASDQQARRFLGPRRASVFTTPPRACLHAADHAAAVLASRAAIAIGLSVQSFHLLTKIAELDALVEAGEEQFVEVHPECAFLVLNAMEPLPPKALPAGAARRRELLTALFGALPPVPRGARPDDLLDAYAVLWSVDRYVRGEHLTFGDGALDRRGLPMRIIC